MLAEVERLRKENEQLRADGTAHLPRLYTFGSRRVTIRDLREPILVIPPEQQVASRP